VVLWFHYLKNRKAFSSEAVRGELLHKFNEIPGISITPERLGGKPSFALSLLIPSDARSKFKSIIDGIIDAAGARASNGS
jgi:hypothetical protein